MSTDLALNLFHGFQHISYVCRKFSIDVKPFINKIINHFSVIVQTKYKTVKLEMLSAPFHLTNFCNVTLLREAGFKIFVMRAYLLHNLNKRSCVGHFYLRIQFPKQCTSLFLQSTQLLLDFQGIHQLRCIFFHIRIHHSQRLFVLCLAVFSKNTETHILGC